MELLPLETVFYKDKIQTQTEGIVQDTGGIFSSLNGLKYHGYEIHMGRNNENIPPVTNAGNVYGTYVHGFFDDDEISTTIVKGLCTKKGIIYDAESCVDRKSYKDDQYNKLAEAVRCNLNMNFIYDLLG